MNLPPNRMAQQGAKRPYETPCLSVYGDIRVLTSSIAGGRNDNSRTPPNHKTA